MRCSVRKDFVVSDGDLKSRQGEEERLALLAERAGIAKLHKINQTILCIEQLSSRLGCRSCSGRQQESHSEARK